MPTDPHLIPVADIEFTPAMLDGYPALYGEHRTAAYRRLFNMFRSPGKDHTRHSALSKRINEFIDAERRRRMQSALLS